ncbi:MAG: sigma-54 dependent transcriptional regulator [Candidatus Binatus sp.]|uniref:sigma-54-dependent transcriptional regulator n=1 Tax=Candidatus Binatus sp. TaxID=2811406 RepID=UPI0027157DEC|nr:sigma-54 dependent transcriptional regulator [Candidatus Binatus sp.]MDO8433956.1 sigma-54 dependent transcriptional regulator [Candidatus Binatus sp.]
MNTNDASWTAQERGPYRILVVEDEPLMRSIIVQLARSEGYEVMEAPAAEVGFRIFEKEKIDLAILDLNLTSGGSGLDLLRRMRELDPEVMGIIVTAYASVESAVEALHQGAYDYITKPFANDHLKKVMRNALEGKALFRENRFLRQELREKYRFESIIGKSDAIESTFRVMEKVARTDSSVLITGESGTGKELVARAIHFSSERANNRFLPINCGALPENLLESELFGYKRGAFTGAGQDKVGLLKAADKGTIFFDEIGELPLALQVKLLRTLQEREAYPLGSNDPVAFDVRVLCATNRNLEVEVKAGRFREELLYRINVININLPALRERKDDIPLLANHFLRKYEKSLARTGGMRFSKGAMRVLINYPWPGNVRELENTIERAAILAETDVIHSHDLPDKLRTTSPVMASIENPGLTLEELEREHIKRVLDKVENDKVKAAQVLGIHLSTLYRKVQRYHLDGGAPVEAQPARSA